MTSLRRQNHLYLRERDRGRKEDICLEKKFYNSKSIALTEAEVLKNAKQCFFMPTHQKRPKIRQTMTYMPNSIFSCQTNLEKAKFLELKCQHGNPGGVVWTYGHGWSNMDITWASPLHHREQWCHSQCFSARSSVLFHLVFFYGYLVFFLWVSWM